MPSMPSQPSNGATQICPAGSSKPALVKTTASVLSDGGRIEIWKLAQGATVAKVVKIGAFGSETHLGEAVVLVDSKTGCETLQGRCKIHGSKCKCWFSANKHLDLLLDWLVKGIEQDDIGHQTLARSLKQSIGMRVRG